MDTFNFNAFIHSLPIVEKKVGELADGTAIYAEVHSMFGAEGGDR